jgi:hypothetical protein
VTFACNGADGGGSGGPAFDRVGTQYAAYGASTQLSAVPGLGVVSIRCLAGAGSDVQVTNPAGSGVHLSVSTGYVFFPLGAGGQSDWTAAGGAPRLVITSASLPSPGHPFAETLKVLVLDVAISITGSLSPGTCAYLVRSSVS